MSRGREDIFTQPIYMVDEYTSYSPKSGSAFTDRKIYFRRKTSAINRLMTRLSYRRKFLNVQTKKRVRVYALINPQWILVDESDGGHVGN